MPGRGRSRYLAGRVRLAGAGRPGTGLRVRRGAGGGSGGQGGAAGAVLPHRTDRPGAHGCETGGGAAGDGQYPRKSDGGSPGLCRCAARRGGGGRRAGQRRSTRPAAVSAGPADAGDDRFRMNFHFSSNFSNRA